MSDNAQAAWAAKNREAELRAEVARLAHENELMTQTLGYQERQALEAEVARLTAELARWQGAEQRAMHERCGVKGPTPVRNRCAFPHPMYRKAHEAANRGAA